MIDYSFIVIGKNECENLVRCFSAIQEIRQQMHGRNIELIYVDSESTDNSILTACSCQHVDIVISSGENSNAAIARNVGADHARGKYLCFIDGDMIIVAAAYKKMLETCTEHGHAFFSGNFLNVYRNEQGLINEEIPHFPIGKDIIEARTGGLFVISHFLWTDIGGMRGEFRKSQDLDLALRLSKRSCLLFRTREIVALHNTVNYIDRKRFYSDLVKGNFLYHGLLIRRNLFNRYTHYEYYRSYATAFCLILSGLCSLGFSTIDPILFYPTSLLLRSLVVEKSNASYESTFVRQFLVDISMVMGLVFFYPRPVRSVVQATICKERQ
jgi:glycosyltransferase involved in cell wall biosynthesis